jgi:phosphoribosylanthranilate isomerase
VQDLEAALEYGADAVGFVLEGSSPRYLTEDRARTLIQRVPPFVFRVGVYATLYGEFSHSLFDACQAIKWGPFGEDMITRRIQAIRVGRGPGKIDEVLRMSANVDAVLLDAYDPRAFGGTGKQVDLEFAAEVVEAVLKPVILAGGLTPENVGDAVRKVRPYAVDVSSGVETHPGQKDRIKIRDFIQAARNA